MVSKLWIGEDEGNLAITVAGKKFWIWTSIYNLGHARTWSNYTVEFFLDGYHTFTVHSGSELLPKDYTTWHNGPHTVRVGIHNVTVTVRLDSGQEENYANNRKTFLANFGYEDFGKLEMLWKYVSHESPIPGVDKSLSPPPRFRVSSDQNMTVIAGMSEGGQVTVLDQGGNVRWELKTPFDRGGYPMAGGISVSPNGQYVAVGTTGPRLYASNGSLLFARDPSTVPNWPSIRGLPGRWGSVLSVSVDNFGRMLVGVGLGDTLYMFDRLGNLLLNMHLRNLISDGEKFKLPDINFVTWSANGRFILATLNSGAIIGTPAALGLEYEYLLLLDERGSLVWSKPLFNSIVDGSLSDDGRIVAATTTCFSHPKYAPWNKYLRTCGLQYFDRTTGSEWLFQIDAPGGFYYANYFRYLPVALSSDGRTVATASDKEILMLDNTGGLLFRSPVRNASYLFYRGSRVVVGGPRSISLYSVTWSAPIVEDLAWTFDVNSPMHARVNLTVTIHPHGENWNDYTFSIGETVDSFHAYEYGTNRILRVALYKEDSLTKVRVLFDSPQGDEYKLTVSFDLYRSAFGIVGSDFFFTWTSRTGIHPRPEKITVILPQGFELVRLQGVSANYTSNMKMGRFVVSFAGTVPPDGAFHWTIVYRQAPAAVTTMTQTPTTVTTPRGAPSVQLPWFMIIGGVIALILVAGLVLLFRKSQRPTAGLAPKVSLEAPTRRGSV